MNVFFYFLKKYIPIADYQSTFCSRKASGQRTLGSLLAISTCRKAIASTHAYDKCDALGKNGSEAKVMELLSSEH